MKKYSKASKQAKKKKKQVVDGVMFDGHDFSAKEVYFNVKMMGNQSYVPKT